MSAASIRDAVVVSVDVYSYGEARVSVEAVDNSSGADESESGWDAEAFIGDGYGIADGDRGSGSAVSVYGVEDKVSDAEYDAGDASADVPDGCESASDVTNSNGSYGCFSERG